MKKLKWMTIFSILFLFPISSYAALDILYISLLEGEVQIFTEETGEWVPASINIPMREGDRIWVAERGRVELHFKDNTYLRLDQKSALEVLTLENNSYQFYLSTGHLFANYRGKDGTVLQIDTPESTVRAYKRGKFRMDVFESGRTEITNFRGMLYAESREGRAEIERGRTLYITERGDAEFGPLPPADEWEKWNRQRDTQLAEWRPPSKYLPEDLRSYSRDFDDNGRWVYAEEYGYVWTPHVVVSVGWAPYRLGRWVWIGGDYIWVSYEPWGWVPYHYGRWSFLASIGWCWVPPSRGAVYWGPGYVGWVITPTHVSWVPLAPREIYYGHGNYGHHSVNITRVNVTRINVEKVVYKNARAANAVTVIHRDTFVTGRHMDVKIQENPFLRERIHIGRPNFQPERATRMPVVREVSMDKRPPASIRDIKVREIKKNRPLVRQKEASVMRPGAPMREMKVKVREGTPEVREVRKLGQSGPTRKDSEKPGRVRAIGREIGKSKPERVPEKAREVRPAEKAVGKARIGQAVDRGMERPKDPREAAKASEKPRVVPRAERRIEKSPPVRPAERGVALQQMPSRIPEKKIERREGQRGAEGENERVKPVERRMERGSEPRQMERGMRGPEGRGR